MDKQEVALLQWHGHQLYISYLKEIWMTLAQKIRHFPESQELETMLPSTGVQQ